MLVPYHRRIVSLAMMLGSLSFAIAHGVSAQGSRDSEARGLFQAGQADYDDGRFEDALDYFKRAQELSGRPELYYNVAMAADRLRLDQEALRAYEAYLEARPRASNARSVRGRVRALRRILAERGTPPSESEERDVALGDEAGGDTASGDEPVLVETAGDASEGEAALGTQEPAPGAEAKRSPFPQWLTIGIGGAVAVGGGVLFGLGVAALRSVEQSPVGTIWADDEATAKRGSLYTLIGGIGAGVGLASVAAGVVWLVVAGGSSMESAEGAASVSILPAPNGLMLRGTF